MKKIILTSVLAFFATVVIVNAQNVSVVHDTTKGYQMAYIAKADIIIPDSTTVQTRTMWDFSSAFNNMFATAWDTLTNTSATADTITTIDTVAVPVTGTIYVRHEVRKIGDTVSYFSGAKPATIHPVIISPRIALNSSSPTTTGGTQTVDYHAGFDFSHLKVLLAMNSTFVNPTLQNANVSLIDSGTYTWTFGPFPSGVTFSYQFMYYNSVDTVYSGINGMTVLPGNMVFINQVDSFGVTDSIITTRTPIICNSTLVATTHIARHNQSEFAHFDTTVTGNGSVINLYHTFTGLSAATDYDVWTTFPGVVGAKRMITTLNPIFAFTITDDSVRTIGTSVRLYATVTVPSGETAMVGGRTAAPSDINFNFAIDAPSMFPVAQGRFTVYQDFDYSTSTVDIDRLYGMYGYLTNGGNFISGTGIQHLYVVPTDTVKPVITRFDTVTVTSTTVELVFTSYDSIGVTTYTFGQDGVNSTVLGSDVNRTITGLLPATTHVFTLQANDDAGNHSLLRTLVVTTDIADVAPTEAHIDSMQSKVCFQYETNPQLGWSKAKIYGSNFQPGARYNAHYPAGPDDNDTIMDVTATSCNVWIFRAAHYAVVSFTITNPGANASVAVTTKVIDCDVTTDVQEIEPTEEAVTTVEESTIATYPNPFTDVITIEVDKTTQYTITSVTGIQVQAGELTEGKNKINLNELAKGIYIVKTQSKLSQKIVKL